MVTRWSCLLAAMLAIFVSNTSATEWVIDKDRSTIGFVASYDSIAFDGVFDRWEGAVTFDPAALGAASIEIDVDMASVNTRSRDRDNGIRSSEWFDAPQFARAVYSARNFTAREAQRYEAEAGFVIKGQSYPLVSSFRWQELSGGTARLSGAVNVDRRRFKIGTGEWADDPIIGFDVKITYDLTLRHK